MKEYRTNSKEVRAKIQTHILDMAGEEGLQGILDNAKAVMGMSETPNLYSAIAYCVQGGNFLIYFDDCRDFLKSLNLNNSQMKYGNDEVWELYKHLIAREAVSMITKANLI